MTNSHMQLHSHHLLKFTTIFVTMVQLLNCASLHVNQLPKFFIQEQLPCSFKCKISCKLDMISRNLLFLNLGSSCIKQKITYIGTMECHVGILMMQKNIPPCQKYPSKNIPINFNGIYLEYSSLFMFIFTYSWNNILGRK